ncbi:MAG TPA: hypothetical protein VH331_02390 [Allosphingosinicella sp.]|jgi:hypothetical protein|nr:hypothetical protein [Allosphingosinicella sp.]
MRAAALLLTGLAAMGPAAAENTSRHTYSLIAATWPSDMAELPCDKEAICDVFVTKVRLREVTTLAGPLVPQPVTLFPGWHGMPAPGRHFLAATWQEKGQWHAHWLGTFDPDGCVPANLLSEYHIAAPRQVLRKDDRICFRA